MAYTHLLITRPEPAASQLAAGFDHSAISPVVIPAYAFAPVCPGPGLDWPWPEDGRRLAVFTSTRAVDFGLRQLPARFLEGVEIAAIGPATAAALERAGQQVSLVPEGQFTSESLLAHPELARAPGSAVIFTAPGGRELLEQGLGQLGWQVRMVHVYRREALVPPKRQVAELLEADGVISVWTSENAMQVLAEALPERAWQRVCAGTGVVTSARLRQRLLERGLAAVLVAPGPDNDSIRACIEQLI